MRSAILAFPLALMVVGVAPCAGAGTEAAMRITTADFPAGGAIPRTFTADGADLSPALGFEGAPAGTRAFALIVDDPDAPVGLWVHWVLYDLPAGCGGLAQNQPRSATLPGGARQGKNSWSRLGWNGPSPPPGRPHRYFFKLYALSSPLGLEPGATAKAVEAAMKGKVLAQAELMGSYGR
jgi:Raf kinase inhibitor-like YbhB/YbcL family protein